MRKFCVLIFFSCCLLLQTFKTINAGCEGSLFAVNSTYSENLNSLFSSLASNVTTTNGFFSTSIGEGSNKIYGLALCGRGYKNQPCVNCVEQAAQETQSICQNRMNSFRWTTRDIDNVSCLVRYANQYVSGKLEVWPAFLSNNPLNIEERKSMMLFRREWEALVNLTLESATLESENSSVVLKFYSVIRAEFTEFSDVYMMMQCTPDILSSECKSCLRQCVLNFRNNNWGSQGGAVRLPSCYFRWDLYLIPGSSPNMTKVSMISHALTLPTNKNKGRRIWSGTIVITVVPTVINLIVFVGTEIYTTYIRIMMY